MIYILNIKLNIYMKKKFILFILTSSNEKLLKISYNSAINQKNHNLDYSIIIVVNSLDVTYFKKVKIEFENIDVEIIQTPSNGKPGMGHNSCIELFKIRKQYEYMLLLDGDDFLYPYALNQLSKCFEQESHLDMIYLKSTDKLKYNNEDNDIFDITLNNNFIITSKLYVEHKLYPWNKDHMYISNCFKNSLCTPIRLFLLNRNIFNYHTSELFHNECELYDDYLTFLYFIKYSLNSNLKCFIIPGKFIYLYNSININSITHNNDSNDMIYYDKIKDNFLDCYEFLTEDWNLTKLPTLFISYYENIKYDYEIDENTYNINLNINTTDIYNDLNYKYIQQFGIKIINEIINSYYDMSLIYFDKSDYNKSYKYSNFFTIHNINIPHISFIYIYSIYKIYYNNIPNYLIEDIKKNIKIAKCMLEFYKITELDNYCNIITNIT